MTGWIPVYDTMHGIRGEVNIIVKVELFSDFNKFRQSSCGVQFFYCKYIKCFLLIKNYVPRLIHRATLFQHQIYLTDIIRRVYTVS